jgi:hypothetical protein
MHKLIVQHGSGRQEWWQQFLHAFAKTSLCCMAQFMAPVNCFLAV